MHPPSTPLFVSVDVVEVRRRSRRGSDFTPISLIARSQLAAAPMPTSRPSNIVPVGPPVCSRARFIEAVEPSVPFPSFAGYSFIHKFNSIHIIRRGHSQSQFHNAQFITIRSAFAPHHSPSPLIPISTRRPDPDLDSLQISIIGEWGRDVYV